MAAREGALKLRPCLCAPVPRDLAPVPMKQSATTMSRLMQPDEANVYGNVHGGVILRYIDETAAVAAWRHARVPKVVTASFERMSFKEPVFVGDLLHIHATVRHTGRTSMVVGCRVEAEEPSTGDIRHAASAHVTFVALDKSSKPTPVPPVKADTDEEKVKMERAQRIHEAIKNALKDEE
ncbi:MAG: acyl-CoA thioesterase [Thermoplasmatota archaeon]